MCIRDSTVAELIRYRMQTERYVHRVGEAMIPTAHGDFRMIAYESEVDGGDSHLALVKGDLSGSDAAPVLVRMHLHCAAGDLFGSTNCTCLLYTSPKPSTSWPSSDAASSASP